MGDIADALDRAGQETFTRQPPKSAVARMRLLVKAENGSTLRAATRLGVSQRTVERYLTGQFKRPRPALADALARETAKVWQPRVRERRRRRAATSTGITVETRARFGYTAPIGTTDDPRMRRLTVHLPPVYAHRLFEARQQGASDRLLRGIVAEGLREIYFQDNGHRAQGLDVEITDIDYLDVSY
ncbi:telomere-protecting terminal protein Tpg [Streptomyces sp. NPDC004838]